MKIVRILIKFTSDKHTVLPAVAELGARPRPAGTARWPVSHGPSPAETRTTRTSVVEPGSPLLQTCPSLLLVAKNVLNH